MNNHKLQTKTKTKRTISKFCFLNLYIHTRSIKLNPEPKINHQINKQKVNTTYVIMYHYFFTRFSAICFNEIMLHLTIVSTNTHVSSLVFSAGTSTTYDSTTTVHPSHCDGCSVVTDR
ncbi:hypothetical protein Hanom_Chr07g00676201 [Helianthus anomalus]